MFFRPATIFASVCALLVAQPTTAAVVRRSRDNFKDVVVSSEHVVRSLSYNTTELEDRQGAIGLAGDVISGITSIITGIQDGINADKEARSSFTQNLVGQMHAQHPDFNWIICHTKHDYKFDGQRGKDWDHRHQEFDIKIGGTIGYEIYNLKSGEFNRRGDGGYLNWAFIGNVLKRDDDGKHVVFGKP
ncbi:hypothetical protein ONZ45_g3123 [Pleurotus djamor]|nr:hypothetical protein ONZ45_g18669 [Pleurotus djamor]KAJ8519993.1 hypothetical protein ONZ45_g3123 [Pleurotus djamor]